MVILKFRAHFSRVNMQRGDPNVWTVYTSRGCFHGEKIVLEVPVETVFKPNGAQPRAYFTGRGVVTTEGGTIFVRSL